MKLSTATLAFVALATPALSSIWGGSAGRVAYNKWHETELERWLSDHNIPFPKPADRKDLEDIMKTNWDEKVAKPYNSWDTNQLYNYLTSTGQQVKKGTEKNKDTLLSQVAGAWQETSEKANEAYGSVEGWIFDTWTDSQLKSFLDYNGIPNPSPRTRDSLLSTARSNYQSVANKVGETFSYPGDWLYTSWSDSDLKAWADERGIPAPQPNTRDKLIANVRRNARIASNDASSKLAEASKSGSSATAGLSNTLIDSWSDTQLKDWFDRNGIKVPQGSKSNELKALARKHAARLSGNNVQDQAASAYGAATSSAGNYYAQASDNAYSGFKYYYDWAMNQVGFAGEEVKSSLSSAASVASKSALSASASASSLAPSAASSLSSAASVASASASSAASLASKSADSAASSASKEAAKTGGDAASAASSAASSASSVASVSAASASRSASASASSASSAASKRAKQEL